MKRRHEHFGDGIRMTDANLIVPDADEMACNPCEPVCLRGGSSENLPCFSCSRINLRFWSPFSMRCICHSLVKDAAKGPGTSLIAEKYRRHVKRPKRQKMEITTGTNGFIRNAMIGPNTPSDS